MKKIIFLALVTLGMLALGGCSLSGGTPNGSANPSVSQTPAQVPAQTSEKVPTQVSTQTPVQTPAQASPQTPAQVPAQVAPAVASVVSIQNFAFNPSSLPVKKGATVTWTNNDSVPHQIKSTTFNSNLLSNGQTYSFTFNDVGTFDYSCAVHPSMVGKIIVSN